MKKPELAFKCFIRFLLARAAMTWGVELMAGAFRVYPVSYTHLDVYKRQVVPQAIMVGSVTHWKPA